MVKPLERKKSAPSVNNPWLDVKPTIQNKEHKEEEQLKTMKVPENIHDKLKALRALKKAKLYEMVDILIENYVSNLSDQEKAIYEYLLSQNSEKEQ